MADQGRCGCPRRSSIDIQSCRHFVLFVLNPDYLTQVAFLIINTCGFGIPSPWYETANTYLE
jgi:hypothetical protein